MSDLVVCNGNRETFRQHLFSKQSAIYEMWTLRHKYRIYADRVISEAPPTINLIILDSAKKMSDFYDTQGLARYSPCRYRAATMTDRLRPARQ